MRRTFLQLLSVTAAAAALLFGASAGFAAPVDGPWLNADPQGTQGNGPITDGNTNSPIVGDAVNDPNASSNLAVGEMIDSPFDPITLAAAGDKLVFTGTVKLQGTVNSTLSSGTPRTQFRFGRRAISRMLALKIIKERVEHV